MPDAIRVLLADDHAILRSGLRLLLATASEFEVVGEAADGEEAVLLAQRLKPEIVLLDVSMPKLDGLSACAQLRAFPAPPPQVLMLTMHDDPAYVARARSAGAAGYLPKRVADDELLAALRAVAGGRGYWRAAPAPAALPEGFERLTEREREVLGLLAEGFTNQQIAEKLVLSVRTVETHRAHLHEKLGVSGRAALVATAKAAGLGLG